LKSLPPKKLTFVTPKAAVFQRNSAKENMADEENPMLYEKSDEEGANTLPPKPVE
jgi:hypothetical protein